MPNAVATRKAKLMNDTYELLKPLSIVELRRARNFAIQFQDRYYREIYTNCIDETIRRKENKTWA